MLRYAHSFPKTKDYWAIVEQSLVISLIGQVSATVRDMQEADERSDMLLHENLKLLVTDRGTDELLPTTDMAPPVLLFHHINA